MQLPLCAATGDMVKSSYYGVYIIRLQAKWYYLPYSKSEFATLDKKKN
jgi:hypothetical protein